MVGDQRHLAEHVALFEPCHRSAVEDDVGLALDHDIHLVAEVPLIEDRLVRVKVFARDSVGMKDADLGDVLRVAGGYDA